MDYIISNSTSNITTAYKTRRMTEEKMAKQYERGPVANSMWCITGRMCQRQKAIEQIFSCSCSVNLWVKSDVAKKQDTLW